jgi:hypothetical protein
MAEQAVETDGGEAIRDVKADLDERRIARAVSIGLPVVTVLAALVVGTIIGPAMAILVLAAGVLLGVIALFWASLRVLSGDAALSPELEALDAQSHAVDALSSRKRMLVRALKDLDNERALGKLEEDDHEQLTASYRAELKDVLRRIDASLEPHRGKAEGAALAYLQQVGLEPGGYRGAPPPADSSSALADDEAAASAPAIVAAKVVAKEEPARVTCPSCSVSNEPDASFCKKCGTSLAKESVDEA